MRSQLISLFYRYHAKVTLVYIEVPYHQWQKQNNARVEEAVPSKVLDRMRGKLEILTSDEAHYVIYHVNGHSSSLL
ncbi:hypothetical protein M983_0355 [Proteus myxofaciens ATCC 19692]|uniref:Uncharacterized protein n=1 Tax=Proteus myxofaciens ATCC 19692 TaxID=1354337 RepID=A0A198GJY3_9GAMM|nr:hypothetical protein M983_0355 [Proteus myxofaciens ATCC 19692]